MGEDAQELAPPGSLEMVPFWLVPGARVRLLVTVTLDSDRSFDTRRRGYCRLHWGRQAYPILPGVADRYGIPCFYFVDHAESCARDRSTWAPMRKGLVIREKEIRCGGFEYFRPRIRWSRSPARIEGHGDVCPSVKDHRDAGGSP